MPSSPEGDEQEPRAEGDRTAEARAKALDLLASRPHFRAELAVKLGRRGFEPGVVEACLDRLEESGYLDDREAALGFARGRASRGHWGPARLRAELRGRGVGDSIADEVVREQFADGEREAIEAAAEAWRRRGRGGRDALARFLDRRGFSKGAIVEILTLFAEPGESDHEEF